MQHWGVNAIWVLMQCSDVDAMFGNWCNVQVFIQCWDFCSVILGLIQCSCADAMSRYWGNVWGLKQCSNVNALFGCWCNVQVLMHYSVINALFGIWWNVWVVMHCSLFMQCYGVDTTFGSRCNVQEVDSMFRWWSARVKMQCSGVYFLHKIVNSVSPDYSSLS